MQLMKPVFYSLWLQDGAHKDHLTVLRAFNILAKETDIKCYLFMAGTNIDENNGTLLNEIKNIKYQKNVYLLGEIEKIENLYNSADINILCAKKGKGFPNVLCEAMACGTLCISSESGDALQIVGDLGFIIQENVYLSLLMLCANQYAK